MLFPAPDYLSIQLRRLTEVQPQAEASLWPGRLALGTLAMLDGDPGLGKSLITLDICARVTTGRPMPDGSPGLSPSNVVILNAEDSITRTVRPRLQKLGADLERVFFLEGIVYRQGEDSIRFPDHAVAVRDAVRQTQAKLVVIDPIMDFLGPKVASSVDVSVRRALAPLRFLAEEAFCLVWMVRHLNKNVGQRALYRGTASVAFNALCRSAWLAARDPQHPGRRILAELKNNKDVPQPSLAYEICAGDTGPYLRWHGPVAAGADQLVSRPVGRPPQMRQQAGELLLAFLQSRPRTSSEVAEFVSLHELAPRTVTRVKRELDVHSVRAQYQKQPISYWLLPGQDPPSDIPAAALTPDDAPLEEAAYRDERDAWVRELNERSGQ